MNSAAPCHLTTPLTCTNQLRRSQSRSRLLTPTPPMRTRLRRARRSLPAFQNPIRKTQRLRRSLNLRLSHQTSPRRLARQFLCAIVARRRRSSHRGQPSPPTFPLLLPTSTSLNLPTAPITHSHISNIHPRVSLLPRSASRNISLSGVISTHPQSYLQG